jgi:hypothetical protein
MSVRLRSLCRSACAELAEAHNLSYNLGDISSGDEYGKICD